MIFLDFLSLVLSIFSTCWHVPSVFLQQSGKWHFLWLSLLKLFGLKDETTFYWMVEIHFSELLFPGFTDFDFGFSQHPFYFLSWLALSYLQGNSPLMISTSLQTYRKILHREFHSAVTSLDALVPASSPCLFIETGILMSGWSYTSQNGCCPYRFPVWRRLLSLAPLLGKLPTSVSFEQTDIGPSSLASQISILHSKNEGIWEGFPSLPVGLML